MQVPSIAARIEDRRRRCGSGVENELTGALSERARDARQGEVCQFRLTARSDRNHMVHMEERFLAGLRQATILAPILCAVLNTAAQLLRNVHPAQPGYLRLRRSERI